jgi:hypothetical protein
LLDVRVEQREEHDECGATEEYLHVRCPGVTVCFQSSHVLDSISSVFSKVILPQSDRDCNGNLLFSASS